ncbi:DUF6980 family protein [Aeoliella sp.]|uniref:DUF6980 family protein n=1 Tax=Aeoliella sp. TaxID=2795800 RepID=UPI003CCBB3A3
MREHCCETMSRNVNHVCDQHASPFACPDHLILQGKNGSCGLIVHDGGSSMVEIQFCPWCGAKLNSPLKNGG